MPCFGAREKAGGQDVESDSDKANPAPATGTTAGSDLPRTECPGDSPGLQRTECHGDLPGSEQALCPGDPEVPGLLRAEHPGDPPGNERALCPDDLLQRTECHGDLPGSERALCPGDPEVPGLLRAELPGDPPGNEQALCPDNLRLPGLFRTECPGDRPGHGQGLRAGGYEVPGLFRTECPGVLPGGDSEVPGLLRTECPGVLPGDDSEVPGLLRTECPGALPGREHALQPGDLEVPGLCSTECPGDLPRSGSTRGAGDPEVSGLVQTEGPGHQADSVAQGSADMVEVMIEQEELDGADQWVLRPGYILVMHRRDRSTLFVPEDRVGCPVHPSRFRNERRTEIHVLGAVHFVEDNWREVGEVDPGFGVWRGITTLVFQGRALPWEDEPEDDSPSGTSPGGWEDESSSGRDDGGGDSDGSETRDGFDSLTMQTVGPAGASGYRAPGAEALAAAVDYVEKVKEVKEGTPSAWHSLRCLGDLLVKAAGSVEEAAKSLWEARESQGLCNLSGVDASFLDNILHPDHLAYLRDVRTFGMSARYDGPRERVEAQLHPNAKRNVGQVLKQVWKDVVKQRVLVVSRDLDELQGTISSPFEAVDKLMPDRTISQEKRVVHDQRGVNLGTHKDLHPPALQPTHSQIARRILMWKRRCPGLPILMSKKDVSGAFRLLWVDPRDAPLFAGDLPWQVQHMVVEEGEDCLAGLGDLTVIYLVSSFGFSGAPGEWSAWGRATEEFHRSGCSPNPRRDGTYGFDSKILVDDCILIEPWMGLRPWVSADHYESGVKQLLGKDAINKAKDLEEGAFRVEQTVWGVTMNTQTEQVHLPERRILKGAHLLQEPAFDFGAMSVTLRQVQSFRGIGTGWTVVVPGLRNELKAADVFLHGPEPNSPAEPRMPKGSPGVLDEALAWEDLWSLFEVCRWLCSRSELWPLVFGGELTEFLEPKERIALPGRWEDAVFVTSDATLDVVGSIDWTHGLAAKCLVADLKPWLGAMGGDHLAIHLTEFLSLVAFACEVGHRWKGKVIIYAGDNQVVRSWVATRRARVRHGRLLIRVLNMVEMRCHCQVLCGWMRTFHNVDSDFITRTDDEAFKQLVQQKGWEVVDLGPAIQQALEDSERFGPCFLSWFAEEDRRQLMQLKERRVQRQLLYAPEIPWEAIRVHEWAAEGRLVRDFENVIKHLGAHRNAATREKPVKVVVGTVGADVAGRQICQALDFGKKLAAKVTALEGPVGPVGKDGVRTTVGAVKPWSS